MGENTIKYKNRARWERNSKRQWQLGKICIKIIGAWPIVSDNNNIDWRQQSVRRRRRHIFLYMYKHIFIYMYIYHKSSKCPEDKAQFFQLEQITCKSSNALPPPLFLSHSLSLNLSVFWLGGKYEKPNEMF